jgi:two-component system cell cycle sensor histidine kinase/response regulator CckA
MDIKPSILIVDDDPPTCVLISDILQRAGYGVMIAHSGSEAVDAVERNRFDLATVDVVMPGMSGEQVAQRLRAVHPDLRVLFVTGYPEALFQAQPVMWEGEAFLEKPCTDKGLVEAVSLLLTGSIKTARYRDAAIDITPDAGDKEPML